MKIEWQETDIIPGRQVTNAMLDYAYIIGYRVTSHGNEYGLIDMRDGMFAPVTAKLELAMHLTVGGFVPVELVDPYRLQQRQRMKIRPS